MAHSILENGKLSKQKGVFVPLKRDSASHLIPYLNVKLHKI